MTTQQQKQTTKPPSIFASIVAGFDAVTNHIGLLLFPIGLDLLLWFSPRLRIKQIIESWLVFVNQTRGDISEFAEMSEMMGDVEAMWLSSAEQFNLLSTLRSYPVGVPSLAASPALLKNPLGAPTFIDISSIWLALLIAGALTIVGLIFGTLYFSLVGQIAIHDELRFVKAWSDWPRASLQIILLALFWLALILGISIPVSCGMVLFALAGVPGISLAVVIFGSVLLWIAFPLLFVPHGIMANRATAWASIRKSVQIIRMTLPTTATFIVSLLLISQLLDLLWMLPPEDSWLTLIGFAGHAFVATGLLSASFVYYQRAGEWVQAVLERQTTPHKSVV